MLPEDPKKKKKQTAAEQADAIEGSVLGAGEGTSAGEVKTVADRVKKQEREKGQAAVDKDKFTVKAPKSVQQQVTEGYTGFGLGGAAQVDKLAKAGKTVQEIVKALRLKPKSQK